MSKPLNIIFAGTPQFSVACLQALIESEHNVVAVYTQPDRPAGRGRKLTPSAVKQVAVEHNIPVFQPKTLRDADAQQQLKALQADLMIVVAYGLILPKAVLDAPSLGCINVHASLLPAWRGAAPIQYSILKGDSETGVTIMQMDEGLDTGDMLKKIKCPINNTDTSASMHDKLSHIGAEALLLTLSELQAGRLKAEKQDESLATYAHKIAKSDAQIDWSKPAKQISQQIRAYIPWPIAFSVIDDVTVKVHQAEVLQDEVDQRYAPGCIIEANKDGIDVMTADKVLRITHLQFAGTRVLTAQEVLNSRRELFAPSKQFAEVNLDDATN